MSKEEDLPVTEKEEQKFWGLGHSGCKSAISLQHIVYYYYGKLFRFCSGVHSNITVANVDVGSDFVVKTFHGGFTDCKYEPSLVKRVCHPLKGKQECCLDEIYNMCTGLVRACSSEVTSFYFNPKSKRFAFHKQPWELKRPRTYYPRRIMKEALSARPLSIQLI